MFSNRSAPVSALVFSAAVVFALILIHPLVGFIVLLPDIARMGSPGSADGTADARPNQIAADLLHGGMEHHLRMHTVHHDKFIASGAVYLIGEAPAQLGRCTANQIISSAVAHPVIELFETIEVQAGHAHAIAAIGKIAVPDFIEAVLIVHAGKKVPVRQIGQFLFLCFQLFFHIRMGLLGHMGWKAHIVIHHLPVGVGNVNVAASQLSRRLPEHRGNPLMDPQINLRLRCRLNPHPAHAQIRFRSNLQHMIFFVMDDAFGHLSGKLSKDSLYSIGSRGAFLFPGANPKKALIKMRDDPFHIAFAVVQMHHVAGEVHDFPPPGNRVIISHCHTFSSVLSAQCPLHVS